MLFFFIFIIWYIDLIIWLAPASWSAPRAPPCEHLPGDPDRRYRRASASLEHHAEYQLVKPVPTLERTQLVEIQDYAAFLGLLHLGFTCFQCFHASPIIVLPAIHFWRAASLFPPRLPWWNQSEESSAAGQAIRAPAPTAVSPHRCFASSAAEKRPGAAPATLTWHPITWANRAVISRQSSSLEDFSKWVAHNQQHFHSPRLRKDENPNHTSFTPIKITLCRPVCRPGMLQGNRNKNYVLRPPSPNKTLLCAHLSGRSLSV